MADNMLKNFKDWPNLSGIQFLSWICTCNRLFPIFFCSIRKTENVVNKMTCYSNSILTLSVNVQTLLHVVGINILQLKFLLICAYLLVCVPCRKAAGTSKNPDICESFKRFWLKFYNGHLWEIFSLSIQT